MRVELRDFKPGRAWVILPMIEYHNDVHFYFLIDVATHIVFDQIQITNNAPTTEQITQLFDAALVEQQQRPDMLFLPERLSGKQTIKHIATEHLIDCQEVGAEEFYSLNQEIKLGLTEFSDILNG